ncbi:MAG: fibronectin type III domain-containing protein [Deltaproteobacteria bacterium]|nr:fibronectin type III domain-containing protein [Deltaproteobacteria bacterium]
MRWLFAAVIGLGLVPDALADERQCRVLDLEFLPLSANGNATPPQIVGWLEDAAGNFVDTIFITQATGTFGIGNRPGRFDFNSGPLWPYGRRITTFPVWSTKQPLRWPRLEFQDGNDNGLSHAVMKSSLDLHFCRPVRPTEFDADGVSCPTERALTDKGVLTGTDSDRYPPREDLVFSPTIDHPSAEMLAILNPFDAVSSPTPPLDVEALVSYAMSPEVPPGDYVLFLEVSKEFDTNASYDKTTYPSPVVAFSEYGLPYRGQPSVIYRVPISVTTVATAGTALEYVGYGDPDGIDGNIREPDDTISNLPGSGAGRLGLISNGSAMYRLRVVSRRELDNTSPDHPRRIRPTALTSTSATVTFIAPGDDYQEGPVKGYEVRYRAIGVAGADRVGEPITEENFSTSTVVTTSVAISLPRTEQLITVEGLLPETTYSIGIRAFDDCRNISTLSVIEVTTTERTSGDVDACFIATAAFGSKMAGDVEELRSFRDRILGKTVLGELAIEAYYTFGPAVSRLIGESELLRATARGALEPIVDAVR